MLTPPRGVGLTEPPPNLVIEAIHGRDDITARHEAEGGDEITLAVAREDRLPSARFALLEAKADQMKREQALLADRLASSKWKRDTIDRLVTALIALATAVGGYLLGSR